MCSFDVCLSVCLVCVCVCAQQTGQSDQFKTVEATIDFKFGMHVSRDSPDVTP